MEGSKDTRQNAEVFGLFVRVSSCSVRSIATYARGVFVLITPTSDGTKCLIAGVYTVKSVGATTITTEEAHLGNTNCIDSGNCLAAKCEMRLADAGVHGADAAVSKLATHTLTGEEPLGRGGASGQVRGFKGLGPAKTEGPDEYACTIHTRECTKSAAGFCYIVSTTVKDATKATKTLCEAAADRAWGYWSDSVDKACESRID